MFIVTSAGQAEAVEVESFELEEQEQDAPAGPRPPEWWTEENTAKWQAEVWGGEADASEAQRGWGRKLGQGDYIAKGKFPPPTAKQYREWAKGETRPRCMTFYDGKEMIS